MSISVFDTDFVVTAQTLVQLTDTMACESETAGIIPYEATRKSKTGVVAHGTASTRPAVVPHESDRVSQQLDDASVDFSVNGTVDVSVDVSDVSGEALGSAVLDVMHDPWRVEGLDLQGPNYAIVRRDRVCPIQRAGAAAGYAAGAAAVAAEREASPNEPVLVGKKSRRRGKGKRATGGERVIGGRRGGSGERERRWEGASKSSEERSVIDDVSSRRGGLAWGHVGDAAGAAGFIRAAAGASASPAADAEASESVGCGAEGIAPGRLNRGARGGGVAESGGGRGGAEWEAEGGGSEGEERNGAERLLSEAAEARAPHSSNGKHNAPGEHGGNENGSKKAEGRDGREAREGSNVGNERDERDGRERRRSGESASGALSTGVGLNSGRRGAESYREGGENVGRGAEEGTGGGGEGAAVRGGMAVEGPAVGGRAAARVEEEDEQYARAVRADPSNALLLCDYARFLCEIKDYPRADQMFRRAAAASQAEGRARMKGRAARMDQSPNNPTDNGALKGVKGAKGVKGVKGVKGMTGVEEGEVLVLWAKAVWEGWRDGERALALFDHAVEVAPHDCYVLAAYASFLWGRSPLP
ncbi:unnamed protein product [Closterium sp. Yama58-4]|nr:unnamed protein product [Closterium sp. Yama58-4]